MIEVPIKGFFLVKTKNNLPLFDWFPDTIYGPVADEEWILVPKYLNKNAIQLLVWCAGSKTYGGAILNRYGKGYALYLTSFLLLHPSFDGGWTDIPEITRFYHNIIRFYMNLRNYSVGVNPWPGSKKAAFCITLDDGGKLEEYKRTLSELLKRVPKVSFFVTGKLKPEILRYLKKQKGVELANHSYSHPFSGI